jgi:AAA ATPase-like protein
MTSPRLQDYALDLAGESFIGRERELADAEAAIAPDARSRVLYVHGPGGVGKSALLRELARRTQRSGAHVVLADCRALAADPDATGEVLASASGRRPLVVLDEADALGPGLLAMRERIFALLPSGGRIVLAGRAAPDHSWGAGFDDLVADLPLGPLTDATARALLVSRGVAEDARLDDILSWAGGLPLALTVAARSVASGRDGSPLDVGDNLIRLLADRELDGIDPAILDVAALCWAVDARLLAAVLSGQATRGAIEQLRSLSVAERIGHRVALHPLLAEAIRARLHADAPDRYLTLRRRIADHLTTRAMDGDAHALHELTNLIENPVVRQGAGLDPSHTHIASPFRPGDAVEALADSTIASSAWWQLVEPWLSDAPRHVTVVHRLDTSLAGIVVCVPATLIGDEPRDPELTLIARYLAVHGLDPERTLVAVAPHSPTPTQRTESIELIRVANAVMIARTGIVNPRWLFAPLWAGDGLPDNFFRSFGYAPVPSLARRIGDRDVEWWLADFGPGGLIGRAAAMVGLETGGVSTMSTRDGAELLSALRGFRDDRAISARSHADTRSGEEVDDIRRDLRLRLDALLGAGGEADRAALGLLALAYLEPGIGERAILERLHVGRTTYYRMLRAAKERLLAADSARRVTSS